MIVLAALSLLRMRRRAGNRRVTARSSFG
jgi:hypothetical protein